MNFAVRARQLLSTKLGPITRPHLRPLSQLTTIEQCPQPELCCQSMPDGLDIERQLDISNSIPAYTEQILVSTGKKDWSSRIEEDSTGTFVRELKQLLGARGKYSNPSRNFLLTHSSFPPRQPDEDGKDQTSAYLLPSFRLAHNLSTAPSAVDRFAKEIIENVSTSEPVKELGHTTAVHDVLVLICSHGTRDSRCGILGPILEAEFKDKLKHFGVSLDAHLTKNAQNILSARLALISHIGGHRWAGNVIVAVPPHLEHNLAGKVIWYGRVGPEHVEGIVRETIIGGNVIKNLFRGGIDQHRQMLKL